MAIDKREQITVEAVYTLLAENLEYIGWAPISPQERAYILQHVHPFPTTEIESYDLFVKMVHRRLATMPTLSPPDWDRLGHLAPDGARPPEELQPRLDRSFTVGFGVHRRRLQRVRLNLCPPTEDIPNDEV